MRDENKGGGELAIHVYLETAINVRAVPNICFIFASASNVGLKVICSYSAK